MSWGFEIAARQLQPFPHCPSPLRKLVAAMRMRNAIEQGPLRLSINPSPLSNKCRMQGLEPSLLGFPRPHHVNLRNWGHLAGKIICFPYVYQSFPFLADNQKNELVTISKTITGSRLSDASDRCLDLLVRQNLLPRKIHLTVLLRSPRSKSGTTVNARQDKGRYISKQHWVNSTPVKLGVVVDGWAGGHL